MKEACAYVHPPMLPAVLTRLTAYMHGTNGLRPRGWPAITEFKVLDDRGGTGCYQVRVPELKVSQLRLIVADKHINVAMEDA